MHSLLEQARGQKIERSWLEELAFGSCLWTDMHTENGTGRHDAC